MQWAAAAWCPEVIIHDTGSLLPQFHAVLSIMPQPWFRWTIPLFTILLHVMPLSDMGAAGGFWRGAHYINLIISFCSNALALITSSFGLELGLPWTENWFFECHTHFDRLN
jgi:hypothetical protein